METISGMGKLYDADEKQVIATINYQLWHNPPTEYTQREWHGSFISEDEHLFVQGEYIIELQDKRKGRIIITNIKIQSGATSHYQFQGSGPLK